MRSSVSEHEPDTGFTPVTLDIILGWNAMRLPHSDSWALRWLRFRCENRPGMSSAGGLAQAAPALPMSPVLRLMRLSHRMLVGPSEGWAE